MAALTDFRVKNGLIVSENLSVLGNTTLGNANSDTTLVNGDLTVKDGDLLVKDSSNTTVFSVDPATGNIVTSGTISAAGTNTELVNLDLSGTLTVDGAATIGDNAADTHTLTGTFNTTGQLNVDNLRLDGNTLSTTNTDGNLILDPNGTGIVSVGSSMTVDNNLTITGNLTVNGTTTSVNSTVTTLDDPILTLGGDTAPSSDDGKDRGVEFRYYAGGAAKVGFIGWDNSSGKFVVLTDATNSSEVFSGTKAELDATVDWSNIASKPDPVITLAGDLTGSVTLTDLGNGTLTATIAANSVALGTDTTGNYVATIAGTTDQVNVSGSGSESAAITLSLPQSIATTSSPSFVQVTSTATTGTAPFVVASTTKVANLNADLLDDLSSADFAQITGAAFTGNVSVGGTFAANGGVTLGDASGDALTINSAAVSIPNGLNFDSDTFIIDATNNRVGIGGSPTNTFDVFAGNSSTTGVARLRNTGTSSTSPAEFIVENGVSGQVKLGVTTATGFVGASGDQIFEVRQNNAARIRLNTDDSITLLENVTVTNTKTFTLGGYAVDGVINDETMNTASATKLITSQAAKAYTDSAILAYAISFGL